MAYKNKVLPIPLSSINSATFTGAYQLLTPAAGLANPAIMLHLVNDSNVSVTISYDGVGDHDYLLPSTDRELNFQNNASPQNFAAALAQGTKIYVKGAAGAGLVLLSGWYSPTY
jgi:hypothetical protein